MDYDWKPGRTYGTLVHVHPDGHGNTDYTGYFRDETGEWHLLASFRRPKTDTWYKGAYSFLECFDPNTSIYSRSVRFGNQWVRMKDGTWKEVAEARALGVDEAEKTYYERNARTLLTIWGGPILNDYANRLWNGLVRGYYQGRWDILFNEALASVREDRPFNEEGFETDLKAFEEGWNQRTDVYPSRPVGKTRRVARRIQKDIDAWLAD